MKLSGMLMSMMIVAAACAAAPPEKPWTVSVTTSGGMTGRGVGAWTIRSDGNVLVRKADRSECTFKLSEAELDEVTRLLANAEPERWKDSYVPANNCCDRITWTLEFDEAGRVATTAWLDAGPKLPKDLGALAERIVGGEKSIRAISAERCK